MKHSIVNMCFAALITVAAVSVYAVTPKATAPAGDIVTPKSISYGTSTIAGDSAVLNDINTLMGIQADYDEKEKALVEHFQPAWKAAQEKFTADVATVKTVNGWGDDVNYNIQTKQWIKSKKATPPTKSNQF